MGDADDNSRKKQKREMTETEEEEDSISKALKMCKKFLMFKRSEFNCPDCDHVYLSLKTMHQHRRIFHMPPSLADRRLKNYFQNPPMTMGHSHPLTTASLPRGISGGDYGNQIGMHVHDTLPTTHQLGMNNINMGGAGSSSSSVAAIPWIFNPLDLELGTQIKPLQLLR